MGKYQKLRVWQLSLELCIEIYQITNEILFKKDFGLKDQIRRAAVSIVSNIAEGDELHSNKQSIRYFYYSVGSVAEVKTQVIIAKEIKYISESQFNSLIKKCDIISALLKKLIRYRKNNNPPHP